MFMNTTSKTNRSVAVVEEARAAREARALEKKRVDAAIIIQVKSALFILIIVWHLLFVSVPVSGGLLWSPINMVFLCSLLSGAVCVSSIFERKTSGNFMKCLASSPIPAKLSLRSLPKMPFPICANSSSCSMVVTIRSASGMFVSI